MSPGQRFVGVVIAALAIGAWAKDAWAGLAALVVLTLVDEWAAAARGEER